jgi:hypothetical protein
VKNKSWIGLMNWLQLKPETVLLCESIAAASDIDSGCTVRAY